LGLTFPMEWFEPAFGEFKTQTRKTV